MSDRSVRGAIGLRSVAVGVSVTPEVRERLRSFAGRLGASVSYAANACILVGLTAFEDDLKKAQEDVDGEGDGIVIVGRVDYVGEG